MWERHCTTGELERREEARAELECLPSLARYMLAARHNLNNALTSVLGNSELILLDSEALSSNLRAQIETIRNMGMRMNEIMQRFSSLQKEMQLVEEQLWKKGAKAAAPSPLNPPPCAHSFFPLTPLPPSLLYSS